MAEEIKTNEPQWATESESDRLFEIETKRYENGQILKRCKLSDGRVAESRRLKGNDGRQIKRLTDGKEEEYQSAVVVMCVTIDGKKVTIEEIQDLWLDDYTKLIMLASANFLSTQNV